LNDVIAVAAGWNHTIALKGDGTVVGWGDNAEGQTKVPIGLGRVISVAAGRHHSVALRNDGTVVAWGGGDYGQSDVPPGLKNVKSISAGLYHTLVVTDTGSVISWGENSYFQTDVPSGLNGVISVSAGYYHSIALKRDGSIVSWADSRGFNLSNNDFGQARNPKYLGGVTAIAAGGYHTVAMTKNPIFKKQPSSLTNLVGSNAVFNVEVESAADLTYQWRRDGFNLALQNKSYLEFINLKTNQSGKYSVVIMSEYSSVTSSVAVLEVKKIAQAIRFDKIGDQKFTGVPLLVNAVSSSGLPVEIKIVSGPALVIGNNITLLGLGTVTVVASQSGDESFNRANGFIQSFNISINQSLIYNFIS
jgi:alpha-tubulin suppressor-like RCC1 family protein